MKTTSDITTIREVQSAQNKQNYFERPKKRGNPSHIVWSRMSGIIRDNIDTFPPNADFNEIAHIVEDLAKSYGISLPRWAVGAFANQILGLYCCLNFLCHLKTSEYTTLHDSFAIVENKTLLQSFNLSQFRKLTYKRQIDFLLSHVSLVQEILEISNNQKQ